MDPFQIRRVFLSIVEDTKCPSCGTKISASRVNVLAQDKETCLIKISCSECKKSFGGQARMIQKINNNGKKLNTSTLIEKSPPLPKKITPDDVNAVHKFLEIHSEGFSEELQKPSPFLFLSES
jgi:hypothetical protein